jgi:hypothetical protein
MFLGYQVEAGGYALESGQKVFLFHCGHPLPFFFD